MEPGTAFCTTTGIPICHSCARLHRLVATPAPPSRGSLFCHFCRANLSVPLSSSASAASRKGSVSLLAGPPPELTTDPLVGPERFQPWAAALHPTAQMGGHQQG